MKETFGKLGFGGRATAFGAALAMVYGLAITPQAAAQSDDIDIYITGFDTADGFTLGTIDGQNGWFVAPENAEGIIQNGFVRNGDQALEVIDGASFGRAQVNISTDITQGALRLRYDMFVPANWMDTGEEAEDRYEAQIRLELTDVHGQPWGVESGFIYAVGDYNGLPAGTSAFYIEITLGDGLYDAVYLPILADSVTDQWMRYKVEIDNNINRVLLNVDAEDILSMPLPDDLADVSILQTQTQRWGTSPMNNRSVYFDTLRVKDIPAEKIAPPVGFTIVEGQLMSGGLDDLVLSDDSYLTVRTAAFAPSSAYPPVQIEFSGLSPVQNPSELRFILEGKSTQPNILQRIYLYNYDLDMYEQVDARIGPNAEDGTIVVLVDKNTGRFIEDGTGQMKTLATWLSTNFVSFFFTEEVDQAAWHVSE